VHPDDAQRKPATNVRGCLGQSLSKGALVHDASLAAGSREAADR
jgi:hypothetical protein